MNFVTFGMKKEMQFDGKDYPILGGNALAGYTGSLQRIGERTIDVTDKVKGQAHRYAADGSLAGWEDAGVYGCYSESG